MGYGLTIANYDGVSLIDEYSKQVQIVKEGSIVPGAFIQNSGSAQSVTTPYCYAIVLPNVASSSMVFIKSRNLGGGSSNFTGNVALFEGTCSFTITKVGGGAVGQNYIYANLTYGSPVFDGHSSYMYTGYSAGLTQNSYVDVGLGSRIAGTQSYFNGTTPPAVIGLEAGGSNGDVKITFSENFTTAISNNTAFSYTKSIIYFTRDHAYAWGSNWTLDYKFGIVTSEEDESEDHGFQLFTQDGTLAFSSNRANFLIESITSGSPDLGAATLGITDDELPIVTRELGNTNTWTNYWIMATTMGFSTQVVTGSGTYAPRTESWGAGYIFSPPGYGFYDNATATNNMYNSDSSSAKSATTQNGFAMAPIKTTTYLDAPAMMGGSYVSDSWAYDATRSLIIGQFV
jgi:hypothetical protein